MASVIAAKMNRRGADSILTSHVKLGGDVAAAAGPKGRSAAASTDVAMRAEILSYSRSRALFAGISLECSTLRPDNDGNERLYGKGTMAKDVVSIVRFTSQPRENCSLPL